MNPLLTGAAPTPSPLEIPNTNPLAAAPTLPPEKLAAFQQHNTYMSRSISALLTKPDLNSGDVLTAMTDAVKNGSITAQQAAKEIATMPTDRDQLREFVRAHFLQNMEMGKRLVNMQQPQAPAAMPMMPGAPSAGAV